MKEEVKEKQELIELKEKLSFYEKTLEEIKNSIKLNQENYQKDRKEIIDLLASKPKEVNEQVEQIELSDEELQKEYALNIIKIMKGDK